MRYLVIVSIIWAFSFPLIGHYLVGRSVAHPVDSYFIIVVRFGLALLVFAPFMRWRGVDMKLKCSLIAIGAVQIGIMYVCYYQSFKYLRIHEVALFTIFTPFYVSVFYDLCMRNMRWRYLPSIALAVLGAYIIKMGDVSDDFLVGFLWIQGANACFGIGQSAYKYVMQSYGHLKQEHIFGYFYVGALCVGIVSFVIFGNAQNLPRELYQWLILIYLGVIASGLGYFLWNRGACAVDSGVLAIMNNVLIPLAIVANYLVWGEKIEHFGQFCAGSSLILISLWWHYKIIARQGRK
ncbi:hypothetical protein LS71_001625 [Helicobacter jaachi]|uniref:EamA domain-containing protein n=1 Tax=Helicobacter jaachi TaxID=1677920 RepID=A0A4U8TC03_9HELI|nr:EamA family transporter [Helicobacter jaachi]TLD97476.1 hypothetical protein LS71_001625 [Helicobacter jaachi]